jgi:hypothetical protein
VVQAKSIARSHARYRFNVKSELKTKAEVLESLEKLS